MWPWEHLAVGYLGYWVLRRAVGGRPSTLAAGAVMLGALFPDLVDKPLGWVLGVFPSGYGAGHSVFVAVALALFLVGLAWWSNRPWVGVGFAVAFLLHLPADLLYPVLLGGDVHFSTLLWPLTSQPTSRHPLVFEYVLDLFGSFLAHVTSPEGLVYLGFELALLLAAFLAWRSDGYPGIVRTESTTKRNRL